MDGCLTTVDNLPCPKCDTLMMFMGYESYFDGRYSTWTCLGCGAEVAQREVVIAP